MLRHLAILAALVATAPLATAANASVSITSGTRGTNIGTTGLGAVGPAGQSFIADGIAISSFGFQFAVANASQTAAAVTFQLLSGAGLNGTVLASRDVSLTGVTGRTPTWVDFDLGNVALTLGGRYTAVVSSTNTRYALIFGPNISTSGVPASGDAYAGGTLLTPQPIDAFCGGGTCDANFRFTTTAATAVPEPQSWAMLIAGLGVAGAGLRRARRRTPLAA